MAVPSPARHPLQTLILGASIALLLANVAALIYAWSAPMPPAPWLTPTPRKVIEAGAAR